MTVSPPRRRRTSNAGAGRNQLRLLLVCLVVGVMFTVFKVHKDVFIILPVTDDISLGPPRTVPTKRVEISTLAPTDSPAISKEEVKILNPPMTTKARGKARGDSGSNPIDDLGHPLIAWKAGQLKTSYLPVFPTVIWPLVEHGVSTAEALHLEENGVAESAFMRIERDLNHTHPNTIWIGDTGNTFGWTLWCGEFVKRVRATKEHRIKKGLSPSWPIFIVDFTDQYTLQKCVEVEEEVGSEYVQYSKRAIVKQRRWSNETGWVESGEVQTLTKQGKDYLHTPLVVRTDTIIMLATVLKEFHNKTLADPIELLDRPVDVTHFWPLETSKVGTVESFLRTKVSTTVDELGKASHLKVFVGLAGDPVQTGSRGVKSAYIEALLETKIVIATQRDGWEDHYRLMEALVSGAMVMTDRMLSLPAGYESGVSLVEFDSVEDLKTKITYYTSHEEERIRIATEGRRLAMSHHRAWHRMEEVVFGRGMTNCDHGGDCPYIVHASDERSDQPLSSLPESDSSPKETTSDTVASAANSDHPLMLWKAGKLAELPVLPTVVWPLIEKGPTTSEALHIEENGIKESLFLGWSKDLNESHPHTIWIGDYANTHGSGVWCGEFIKVVREAKQRRVTAGLPSSWPIFIVDFTERYTLPKCPDIEAEVGPEFVQYSTRAIVENRVWKDVTGWVGTGMIQPLTKDGKKYRHTPLTVRTDTIAMLSKVLQDEYNMSLADSIEEIDRPVDVSHFWPLNTTMVSTVDSNLRAVVSQTVDSMKDHLNVFVDLAGEAVRNGRRGVNASYIEALLRSKIVVVTQRDTYEDHYRLFEALASGALVFTDRMLSLPFGLGDGESIVQFQGADNLRSKIHYYLNHERERVNVAAAGRRISMSRHRSWHRMEEIVFGKAISNCTGDPDCPFVVHADSAISVP